MSKIEESEGSELNLEIKTKEAEGTIESLEEEVIYSFFMKASKFNTLEEKCKSSDYNVTSGSRTVVREGVHELLLAFFDGKEQFDAFEISGGQNFEPLVVLEANFENRWFKDYLNPLVYNGYPYFPTGTIRNSKSIEHGIPPLTAFYFIQKNDDVTINQNNSFSHNYFTDVESFGIIYNIPDYAQRQYGELRNKAATYYYDKERPERVQRLLNSVFPIIRKGLYKTSFKYKLPGDLMGKSNFDLSFYNSVGQE